MFRFARIATFAALVAASTATPTSAATIFRATLTNGQENPPVTPTTTTGAPRPVSFGDATFVLNDAETALTMVAMIYNLDVTGAQTADVNDNLTAAHIHGPAAPGANAGVRWGFFGAPFNDNNPNDFTLAPFGNGVGGRFTGKWDAAEGNNTTLTAQLASLKAGLMYINFHSAQFGGGEIRGQIVVPEPASLTLLALGLLGVVRVGRRR